METTEGLSRLRLSARRLSPKLLAAASGRSRMPMQGHQFVGRQTELRQLQGFLELMAAGNGGIAFLEGEAGIGKTLLLRELQRRVRATSSLEKTRFVEGYCYEKTGEQNALQPFAEILETLEQSRRRRSRLTRAVLSLLGAADPEWAPLLPHLDDTMAVAGLKVASNAAHWLLDLSKEQAGRSDSLASQYLNRLLNVAPRSGPLVLCLEDAHWIDEASCFLLLSLARKIETRKLAVLVTYRPSYLEAMHPLKRLQQELFIKNKAHLIHLKGLEVGEVSDYIDRRFGGPLDANLSAWLVQISKGHPLFVTQFLSLLEQDGVIRRDNDRYVLDGDIQGTEKRWKLSGLLSRRRIPEGVEAVLEERIQRLVEEELEMLKLGSVQGEVFMSTILAQTLELRELDVLSRLRGIVERHRIVQFYVSDVRRHKSEFYAFEHALMHQAFYSKLSPREREIHHLRVGELLERVLEEDAHPSRKLILDTAWHFGLAGERLRAALYYHRGAQSSFTDGAFKETADLCQLALDSLRETDVGSPESARFKTEVILLLLVASEMRWRGKPELQEIPLADLLEEARHAAERSGDLVLTSQVEFISGKIYITTENVVHGLETLRRSLELAKRSGDFLTEFVILVDLGHEMVKLDLEQGLELLYDALKLFGERIEGHPGAAIARVQRSVRLLEGFIGVGEFDRGDYGEALRWLQRSIEGLKGLTLKDDLLRMSNFLAQVYIAIGRFDEGREVLQEAESLLADETDSNPWRAYNRALLGKLLMEQGRWEAAAEPLWLGWAETQATWQVNLAPIVSNYRAELLMSPDFTGYDLAAAEESLTSTLALTREASLDRSTIVSLSLLSLLKLAEKDFERAERFSAEAMDIFDRMGTMPAVRTEEILFIRYKILRAQDKNAEAKAYLKQAIAVVERKAATLEDRNHRCSFLEHVPLSRAIMAAKGFVD